MRRLLFPAGSALAVFLVLGSLHVDGALAQGRARSDGRILVDLPSPAEFKENPALIQDHPLGVILGTVTVAATGKALLNAMVVLTTVPLVRTAHGATLDRNGLSSPNSYVSAAITDARGEFAFYYVPLEYLTGQLSLVVFAKGFEAAIREQIVAVKGQATRVEVQMVPRQ
jgi:hypothetical protein